MAWILFFVSCGIFLGDRAGKFEEYIFSLINEYRDGLGLNKMGWSDVIADEARNHSKNMADGNVPFGHTGFEERKKNIKDKIPHSLISEVVAWLNDFFGVSSPADQVFESWISNLDHREVIEGPFDLTGVGVVKAGTTYYFTDMFLKKK